MAALAETLVGSVSEIQAAGVEAGSRGQVSWAGVCVPWRETVARTEIGDVFVIAALIL